LKLINQSSNYTHQVSSPQLHAEHHSTTVSWQLDTELTENNHTGKLRTLGELLGEIKDLSGLARLQAQATQVSAVLL